MGNLSSLNFDAQQVEPDSGFDAIPAGKYEAVIVASELTTPKSGAGEMLKLEFQVVSGAYQNRKLFANLCITHASEKAQRIARAHLSAICRAVGVLTPQDTSELHGRTMLVTVKVEKDENGNPRNQLSGFAPRQTPTPTPAMAGGPSTTNKKPW